MNIFSKNTSGLIFLSTLHLLQSHFCIHIILAVLTLPSPPMPHGGKVPSHFTHNKAAHACKYLSQVLLS